MCTSGQRELTAGRILGSARLREHLQVADRIESDTQITDGSDFTLLDRISAGVAADAFVGPLSALMDAHGGATGAVSAWKATT